MEKFHSLSVEDTNLRTFILAASASGKGIANVGRRIRQGEPDPVVGNRPFVQYGNFVRAVLLKE